MMRDAINNGTLMGIVIEHLWKTGSNVTDEAVNMVVEEAFQNWTHGFRGILLDGYPKNVNQAEWFKAMMAQRGLPINMCMQFVANEKILLERIEGRRLHKASGRTYHLTYNPPKVQGKDDVTGDQLVQRPEDTPACLNRRLTDYYTHTLPVLHFYGESGILQTINAVKSIKEIEAEIVEKIKPMKAQQ